MVPIRCRSAALVLVCLSIAACAGTRRPDLGPAETARLSLADVPDAIAILPNGKKAYVTARGKLYVVAPAQGTVLATIPLPPAPRALALSADGARLFVGDFADLQLAVIDTANDTVVQRVSIGENGIPWEASPTVMALSPDGRTLYVGDPGRFRLWAIDTAQPTSQRFMDTGLQPGGVAVDPRRGSVLVAGCPPACRKGELLELDAASLQRRAALDLPAPTTTTAVAPDGSVAYVLERTANGVAVVDPRGPRLLTTIATGNQTGDLALGPSGDVLYVTSFGDKRLLVIDTTSRAVVAQVAIPAGPRRVAASPDGRLVLVTAGTDGLIVFDAAELRRQR